MRIDCYTGQAGGVPLDPRKDGLSKAGQGEAVEGVQPDIKDSTPAVTSSGEDTIEISAGAQELLGPDGGTTRPDAVERARQVLQSGLYNDKAVLEQTAEKIAGLFSAEA
jgi:hypothetical protein